jgi:hypothetical protein
MKKQKLEDVQEFMLEGGLLTVKDWNKRRDVVKKNLSNGIN